jgi:hypothetical protein
MPHATRRADDEPKLLATAQLEQKLHDCHLHLFLPQPSWLGFFLLSTISLAFFHRISCLTTANPLPGPYPVPWRMFVTFGPSWMCGLHDIGGSLETTVDRFPTVKDYGSNDEIPSETSVCGVPTSLVSSGPAWWWQLKSVQETMDSTGPGEQCPDY